MTDLDLVLPEDGDVIDLILADHRRFEELLRDLRDSSSDRDAVRQTFATLLVAHAEAEEAEVYPRLRRKDAISADEADHGEEEHAEGNEALLAVLEADEVTGEDFEELVEKLAEVVNHHITEEELTILNPARDEVSASDREQLGKAFATARTRLITDDCGRLPHVRELVADARSRGLLEDDEE